MNFTLLDWSAIVAYLGITLFLGLYFRSRSGKSVEACTSAADRARALTTILFPEEMFHGGLLAPRWLRLLLRRIRRS